MKTELPVGTYFRFRYHGSFDFGRVDDLGNEEREELLYTLLREHQIPKDAVVHKCVWNKDKDSEHDVLVSRGILKRKKAKP